MRFFAWLASVLAEPVEGEQCGSFARLASLLLLVASIGWISLLVFRNHAVPDVGGLILLMSAPYAMNKTAAALKKNVG